MTFFTSMVRSKIATIIQHATTPPPLPRLNLINDHIFKYDSIKKGQIIPNDRQNCVKSKLADNILNGRQNA